MKKCICCGTEAVADAPTCANCGEGSWSVSLPVEFYDATSSAILIPEDSAPEVSESKIELDKLPDTDPVPTNLDEATSSPIAIPENPAPEILESHDELSDKPIEPVVDSAVVNIPKRRRNR